MISSVTCCNKVNDVDKKSDRLQNIFGTKQILWNYSIFWPSDHFHETWYERCASGGHRSVVLHCTFLQSVTTLLLLWFYSPLLHLGSIFSFLILHTVGRTPWTGDQPVARPLPTHGINAHNTHIHALSGIRTHDPSVRAREDSSCLRPRMIGTTTLWVHEICWVGASRLPIQGREKMYGNRSQNNEQLPASFFLM
jgi:hypothetical protein